MIFCNKILEDPFVIDIYNDILNYAEEDCLDYTEKVLREDIYFILNAKIPKELHKKYLILFVPRKNQ